MLLNYYRVWAEIDLDKIVENVKNIKSGLKENVKICPVIKTDGYGHGAVPVAKALKGIADFYAVATIDEALNLRAHEIFEPILVLGYIHPSKYNAAIDNDIRITLYDFDMLEELEGAAKAKNKKALAHIKLNTGMNRLGFSCDDASAEYIKKIFHSEHITCEGIYSHFYLADSKDKDAENKQFEEFDSFVKRLEAEGVCFEIKHISNSASAIDIPGHSLDMVRLGIAIYGLYPSDEIMNLKLKPALSLKSHIIMLKDIHAGDTIGYGATFKAEKDMKIATIPIGYGDGYQRNLSNKADVLINGKRAPITGRVCMDQLMVDVTDIPDAKKGDDVVLIGTSGSEQISIEELSALSGSFNYEFACGIGKRIPRVYYSGGKVVSTKDYNFDMYN